MYAGELERVQGKPPKKNLKGKVGDIVDVLHEKDDTTSDKIRELSSKI